LEAVGSGFAVRASGRPSPSAEPGQQAATLNPGLSRIVRFFRPAWLRACPNAGLGDETEAESANTTICFII
jgi:hypothetical protein